MTETRTCKDCGEEKPFAQSHWHWSKRNGAHGPRCKECRRVKYYDDMQNARKRFVERSKEAATISRRLHQENKILKAKLRRLRKMLDAQ